jgi:hypothetical protein
VLSGTPAANTAGSYPITIIASNGVGPNITQSFTLTINQAPAVTSASATTFTAGSLGSFTVTASGFPAPTLSEAGTLPAGVTFSAGVLTGTPAANTAGNYNITITAHNGAGSNATQDFTLTIGQTLIINSTAKTTFNVGTAGSLQVTATGFPAPTFSETGTLPVGMTFTPAGFLSGTPAANTAGNYPITITASNGVEPNATQNFTLTVSQALTIASAGAATFTVGSPGSFTVMASGFPAPTFSKSGLLPAGVTLAPGGALSGTPAAKTGGTYPITITAHNGVGSNATQDFTLTVSQTLVINSAAKTTFNVGGPDSFQVKASGFPAPTFSETGTLPAGVSFTTAGVLSGTPVANTKGTYPIIITASNGVGSNATQSFTLTIGQAEAMTSAAATTFTVGSLGSFTVTASGAPPFTFTEAGTLPAGVSFSAAGLLSGTPAANTGGTYSISITARNGATQKFTLTIGQAPTFTTGARAAFTVGSADSFQVKASGFPAPAFSEIGTLPAGVSFSPSGALSGTPPVNTSGSYPITITASNGVGSNATQSFMLAINQGLAITSAASTMFRLGAAGSFSVIATGFPAPTFSETGPLPAGVNFTTAGVLSGTPAAGTTGNYNITVTASNGVGLSTTQHFALTIGQALTITTPSKTTFTAGTEISFQMQATGFPAPTFSETGTLPAGVTFSPAGLLSGTPGTNTGGTYPITITASNGVGSKATQTFALTVAQLPVFTSLAATTFTVGPASSFQAQASGFPTPAFSEAGMLPAGLTFSAGLLSGTPAVNASGNYNITITANNGVGIATQGFTLTIARGGSIQINAVFPPVTYYSYPGMQYSSDFLQYVASSPLVNGINPPLFWSMVDNGPDAPGGQYNWSVYDAAIQPYIDLGKTVNLLVWAISSGTVNQATPAYVMNLVDAVTCTSFPGNGTQTGGYPVEWEPGFEDNYENFITEVLSHYQNNPNIGYIRFGIAEGAAIYPSCDVEQTPYLPPGQSFMQAFLGFDQNILNYIRSQNPPFPVIAPIEAYADGTTYAVAEAANGIANGFGLGNQGLRASDITGYPVCSSDWCGLFAEYSSVPFSPLFEMQPVGLSDPSATCTPSCVNGNQQQTGPLPPLLSFGVAHLVNVFEIYAIDLLLALDPNYPGYSEYHAQYQAALSAVHSGRGSSVTLSPSSLNFGKVPVGKASAKQTITLTNSGSTVLTFSGISTVGTYSETNNCVSQSLAPAQQCTISVVFTPSATGNQGGLLWINDSDPWSPQSAGLAGTGR